MPGGLIVIVFWRNGLFLRGRACLNNSAHRAGAWMLETLVQSCRVRGSSSCCWAMTCSLDLESNFCSFLICELCYVLAADNGNLGFQELMFASFRRLFERNQFCVTLITLILEYIWREAMKVGVLCNNLVARDTFCSWLLY